MIFFLQAHNALHGKNSLPEQAMLFLPARLHITQSLAKVRPCYLLSPRLPGHKHFSLDRDAWEG